MSGKIEKTLIVFKPDALQRGVIGEIMTRFERVGLKLVAAKVVSPDKEFYFHHYENIGKMVSRRGQKTFDFTLEMMQRGPVLAMVLEGVEAVEVVRKLVGTTEPKTAAPGTIRGDFAHISFSHADENEKGVPNLIHASGSLEEANEEIKHWFKPEEIFDYKMSHEQHTR
jgi:nucleoside-diphosphate kinase